VHRSGPHENRLGSHAGPPIGGPPKSLADLKAELARQSSRQLKKPTEGVAAAEALRKRADKRPRIEGGGEGRGNGAKRMRHELLLGAFKQVHGHGRVGGSIGVGGRSVGVGQSHGAGALAAALPAAGGGSRRRARHAEAESSRLTSSSSGKPGSAARRVLEAEALLSTPLSPSLDGFTLSGRLVRGLPKAGQSHLAYASEAGSSSQHAHGGARTLAAATPVPAARATWTRSSRDSHDTMSSRSVMGLATPSQPAHTPSAAGRPSAAVLVEESPINQRGVVARGGRDAMRRRPQLDAPVGAEWS